MYLPSSPPNNYISKELYDEVFEQELDWTKQVGDVDNRGSTYSWGWSYVGNSLIDMYNATGDKKYLQLFVSQAKYIFTQTDENLGIESFTNSGLSLPAWSDKGQYESEGEYSYTYPVHTAMITLPILRFVDTVKEQKLSEYKIVADEFLLKSGEALAIHNEDAMWLDISNDEGFYLGHLYGEGIVSEANKIGIPNRISMYLAACGLYDKLTGGDTYSHRIKKSLNYFKNSLLKYDENSDSYYWSYWEESNIENAWEDISHATLTIYGLFVLHNEVGYTVFTDVDFKRFANIIDKIIYNNASTIKMRKYIHKRNNEEKNFYSMDENQYYYSVLKWSFLGVYNNEVLVKLENLLNEINSDSLPRTQLVSIATFLYTKEKIKIK